MRYQILHTTTYTYAPAVVLNPHVVRLRSRSDGNQTLHSFSLEISPEPAGISQVLDLEGNAVTRMWFVEPTESLTIKVASEVETHCTNPFNYILEPWATQLPIDYPSSVLTQIMPYLNPSPSNAIDPIIYELAQEICHEVSGKTDIFLTQLNQRIYKNCQQEIRETGAPFPPGITWKQQAGSCRDLAVVFIEACRAVGLAARFVSGYQEGDPDSEELHLHAWVEVYLPGAGWRGYDPIQGLVVADRHISLVASALPGNAAPVSGSIRGNARSTMHYDLKIIHQDLGKHQSFSEKDG
ncbi:transglutaminase family protein [Microseira wollei]|uniref:Transglutaminase domain protein n=1 Tax=Microseira wollei NIES-4236 TaxID=2530354 RepID=A0AAV3WH17_9CYAN|nr:transglutaminase family protein [Microseira wollei]GET37974.1 transglutaminase domain protein [Microseira wollei NIES-4236]